MTTAVSTSKAEYLERVASGLADLAVDDREEVLQDLKAHLAELDEKEVEAALGSPDEFVAEFRASAGLDEVVRKVRRWSLTRVRTRLEEASRRLAEVTRWQTWRPLWIWTRGWLLLSTIAVFSGGTAFERFPVPTVGHSTIIGLGSLFLATSFSVWLDQRKAPVRQVGSFLYSSVVVLLLLGSFLSARDVGQTYPLDEGAFYTDQLIGPEGETISNIYAYDLDGDPVEVLLFDQDGRPLRSLPSWVYSEAEHPGFSEPFEYGEGAVEFSRDEFGRIIPNLYPLALYRYTEYGLEPMPPPSLGFPRTDEAGSDPDEGIVPTTTMPGALD
jgi:hypothetical protein